jgi:phytoene synthase
MCVRIFGFDDPVALERADQLGLALQLTNILRDVREDAVDMKRIYLPQDELVRFGIPEAALAEGEIYPGWSDLIAHSVARARTYFATGYEVLRHIPRRPAACVQTMAGIYEELLKKIERDPGLPLRARAALSKTEKLRVVVRSWLSSA